MSETEMAVTNYDSHRELILKWLKILFICQAANLVMTVLAVIPALLTVTAWLSRIVSVFCIAALFSLSAVNGRYRKAAIFYCINLVGGIVAGLWNSSLLTIAVSVCSIIASYQHVNAHSELTEPKDAKLSQRWHALFYWALVVGILSGLATTAAVVIAVLANADNQTVINGAVAFVALVAVIPGLFHLKYLKQTMALYNESSQ